MARITVNLLPEERRALQLLSENERRNPRDQAAILIRERLYDLGILTGNGQTLETAQPQPVAETSK